MTRELKLALIVGFSLVLVVMVLVSDHLSKARKAELAPPANEIALTNKIGSPQASALNPSDGSAMLNPNTLVDPLAMNTPGTNGTALNQPVEIRQSNGTIESQISLEEAARKMGLATKEGNSTGLIGVEPTFVKTNDLYPPSPISNAPSGVTPMGDNSAPAPLPTRYAPPEGAKLGPSPTTSDPLAAMKKEIAAPSTEKLHKVESGESLYGIAKHYYGNGKYWKQLLEYNKATVKSETSIKLGTKIKIPELAVLTGKPADSNVPVMIDPKIVPPTTVAKTGTAKGKTYVVQKGDTPGAIAQKALGTSKRARELMDLNKITNDAGLRIGMVLQLPE